MLRTFNVVYKKSAEKIEKIYVFGEKDQTNKKVLKNKHKVNDDDIKYIDAYIHSDDTVSTLKQKIFYFTKNKIPIEEMYLFSKKKELVSPEKIFNILTQNQTIDLDYETFINYAMNLDNNKAIIKKIEDQKENYIYEDFKKILSKDEYTVDFPIGMKFIVKQKILNTVDPYKFTKIDKLLKNQFDLVFTSESKKLLFQYGDILDNTIYLTYAEDVLKDGDEKKLLKTYFPSIFMKLEKDKNLTYKDIKDKRNEQLQKDEQINKYFENKMNEKVDLFYKLRDIKLKDDDDKDKKKVIKFVHGIKKIMFTIHQEKKIKLPLDTLFKLIKTDEKIPFIKYNPGNRRENIYRLFTNKISTNGKKIPILYNVKKRKNKIMKVAKVLATFPKRIGFFIRHKTTEQGNINIFCEILENGSIEVRINKFGEKEEPVSIKDIEKIVEDTVNINILQPISKYFQETGYEYYKFEKLKHKNIEINDIEYIIRVKNKNNIDLTEYGKMISDIFEVSQPILSSTKSIKMRYKKISNYNKMNAMNSFIIEQMQISKNIDYIVKAVMSNYSISSIEAKTKIMALISEMKVEIGLFENKKVIREHPGFPIEIKQTIDMQKEENEKLNIIKIHKINNIEYIDYLKMYITSMYKFINVDNIIDDNNSIKTKINKIKNINEISLSKEKEHVSISEQGFSKRKSLSVNDENKIELSDDDDSDDDFLDGLGFGDNIDDDDGGSIDLDNIEMANSSDEEDEEDDNNDKVETEKKKSIKSIKKEDDFNFDNLRVKGMENYFLGRLRSREPRLFKKDVGDGYKAYTKSCVAQYAKQPIALTDAEKKYIDEQDANNKIKSYDEHITYEDKSKQHYICPRFWCLQDENNKQRSLSVNQINEGECGGWDAVIWSQDNKKGKIAPGKKIFEFSDTRFHLNKKPKEVLNDELAKKIVYKPMYPSFKGPENHPDNLCVPCCFTVPTFKPDEKDSEIYNENFEKYDDGKKTTHKYKYMYSVGKDGSLPKCKEGKECVDKNGKIIFDNVVGEKQERTKEKSKRGEMYKLCNKDNNKDNEAIRSKENPDEQPLKTSFPLMKNQLGYLLPQISKFLNYSVANKCHISINDVGLKLGKFCLMRKGVERKRHQTFLSCIAEIYNDMKNYNKQTAKQVRNIYEGVIPVKELKEKMITHLDIDKFISYQNGNLVKLFEKDSKKINLKAIEDSKFYKEAKKVSKEGVTGKIHEVVSAYENYQDYLRNDKETIDYKYIWDMLCLPYNEGGLFKKGMNLIILNSPNDDITGKIQVICPTDAYTNNYYDPNRPSIILYSMSGIYEPLFLFEKQKEKIELKNKAEIDNKKKEKIDNKKKEKIKKVNAYKIIKTFDKYEINKYMKSLLKVLQLIPKYCKPFNRDNEEFKNNLTLKKLIDEVEKINYTVKKTILNLNSKVIGIIINKNDKNDKNDIFLPCKPSGILINYDFDYYHAIPSYTYKKTFKILEQINKDSKGEILCKPVKKIVSEEGFILGIITETNQFIKVKPGMKYESIMDEDPDGIKNIKNMFDGEDAYDKVDNHLILHKTFDRKRQEVANKIKLESNFYNMFRATFRNVINKNQNIKYKKNIKKIIKDNIVYVDKIRDIHKIIKRLMNSEVKFDTFELEGMDYKDMIKCFGLSEKTCKEKAFCAFSNTKKEGKKCKLILPEKNLFFKNVKNDEMYYLKLADELIRYPRLNKFILSPTTLLNYREINYDLHDNEIVLLEVLLREEYFTNIKIMKDSEFINKKNVYDTANPLNKATNTYIDLEKVKDVSIEKKDDEKKDDEKKEEEKKKPKKKAVKKKKETKKKEVKKEEQREKKSYEIEKDDCRRAGKFDKLGDKRTSNNLKYITENDIFEENTEFTREFYKNTPNTCGLNVIQKIIKLHTNKDVTFDTLYDNLADGYVEIKQDTEYNKSFDYWVTMTKKFNKKKDFKKYTSKKDIKYAIKSDDYYLTWMDYFILAELYKIPIIFLNEESKSKMQIKEINKKYSYIVINKNIDYHYVIIGRRVSIKPGKNDLFQPDYSILKYNNKYKIYNQDIKKYNEMVKNSYDNIKDYIKDIQRNKIKGKPKIKKGIKLKE